MDYTAANDEIAPEALEELRRQGVVALFLFGSQVHGRTGGLSDTDVAVLLEEPMERHRTLDRVAALEPIIQTVLPSAQRLELTLLNTAPVSLQLEVLRTGGPLVVLEPQTLATFRENVMNRAGDLVPFLAAYRADRLRGLYA